MIDDRDTEEPMTAARIAFEDVYRRGLWRRSGEPGGLSGPGSAEAFTEPYRHFLTDFLANGLAPAETVVVDLGCGDWEFSRLLDWPRLCRRYIGIDCVASVIEKLRGAYASDVVSFRHFDFSHEPKRIPDADVYLLKDVLQHWPVQPIVALLGHLRSRPRCRCILVTNTSNQGENELDIAWGEFRPLAAHLPPLIEFDPTPVLNFRAKQTVRIDGIAGHTKPDVDGSTASEVMQGSSWSLPRVRKGGDATFVGPREAQCLSVERWPHVLPAHLPSRTTADEPAAIPRIIWQSWIGRQVSEAMFQAVSSWIDRNPEYQYRFLDDEAMAAFVRNFDCFDLAVGEKELRAAFDKVNPPAAKADLLRYLLLYRSGGVWADIDTACREPLSNYVEPSLDAVFGFGALNQFRVFMQHLLICAPRHPFMKAAVEYCVRNILNEYFPRGLRHVFTLTGPVALTCAINGVLGHDEEFEGYEAGDQKLAGTKVRIEDHEVSLGRVVLHYGGYKADRADRGLKQAFWLPLFNG